MKPLTNAKPMPVPSARPALNRPPTAEERRFDEIGWVKGLREAERLARASNRPVFLFTNVGEMDIGRC